MKRNEFDDIVWIQLVKWALSKQIQKDDHSTYNFHMLNKMLTLPNLSVIRTSREMSIDSSKLRNDSNDTVKCISVNLDI